MISLIALKDIWMICFLTKILKMWKIWRIHYLEKLMRS